MGILTEEIRLVAARPVKRRHVGDRRVHVRVDVGNVVFPFIMNHAGGVDGFGGLVHGIEILASTTLVAQRPEDDRGMIAVALHHPYHAVYHGRLPVVLAADRVVAVALHIGFVHHVEAVSVVQGVHTGIVGVMGSAHRVDVVQLHQFDVLLHGSHRDGLAQDGMCGGLRP